MTTNSAAPLVRFDKYELLDRLGHGGMAEVYRARLPGVAGFAKIVGIKKLLPHLVEDAHVVALFVNEAKIAAEVQHRNIVQVFELGRASTGEYFIAMEYVEGTDLRIVLQDAARLRRRIPPWLSIFVVGEVLAGLGHAHALKDASGRSRNIVHRDVTPSNVFISRLGDVKLSDFGVAHDESRDPLTTTGGQKGKAAYMSPEQVRGEKIDARTDVFAAGTVLWECLAQQRLFGGRSNPDSMYRVCFAEREPPSRLAPDIPSELDELVLRAVSVDPGQRPASAREFRDELLHILHGLRERVYAHDVAEQVASLLAPDSVAPFQGMTDDLVLDAPSQPRSVSDAGGASLVSMPYRPAFTPAPMITMEAPAFGVLPILASAEVEEDPPLYDLSVEDALPDLETLVSQAVEEAILDLPAVDDRPRNESSPGNILEIDAVSEAAIRAWGKAMPTMTRYAEADALWLRSQSGVEVGPIAWSDAWHGLKHEAATGGLARVSISADGQHWMAAHDFAELTGTDLLRPPLDLESSGGRSSASGSLGRLNVAALFHRLSRDRFTGWLTMSSLGGGERERREVRWADGLPTLVRSPIEELQDVALLVAKKLLPKHKVGDVMARVVRERRPLAEVAGQIARADLRPYQAIFMKDRLEDVFRWRGGRYTAHPDAVKRRERPLSLSIHSLLLDMIVRAKTQEELRDALLPHLDTELVRTERFSSVIGSMRLTEAQIDVVRAFGSRTLASSLRALGGEERFALALGHLLIECELLVPKP